MNKSPLLVISLGDPAGIGYEVTLKALKSLGRGRGRVLAVGSFEMLEKANRRFRTGLKLRQVAPHEASRIVLDNQIPVLSVGNSAYSGGRMAIESVNRAVDLCLAGLANALVTAPLNKARVQKIIPSFDGHTDYLMKRSGAKRSAMMFVSPRLKITLATMHMPLREVSRRLTQDGIVEKIELTYQALERYFGIKDPKIAVSALNPHGSEFGSEEKKVISPAIAKSRKKYPNVFGPIPGDEIFRELWEGKWDAGVSMYHDQALAPFKMMRFRDGVNLTLGLPFIRTSPDHGTAFDIAGQNKADCEPMKSAIQLAAKLAKK